MPQLIPNMTITATDASGMVLSTTTGVSAVAAAASIDGSLVPGIMHNRATNPTSPCQLEQEQRDQGQADALISSLDFLFQDEMTKTENVKTEPEEAEVKPNLPDLLANALLVKEENDSADSSPGSNSNSCQEANQVSRKRKQSPPSGGRSPAVQTKKKR